MTQRAPFGSQPGEIASFDLALALRRREESLATVRENLERGRVRRLRAWLVRLSRRHDAALSPAEGPR